MLAPIVVDPPRRYASRFKGKLLSGEKIATRVVPRSKQKKIPKSDAKSRDLNLPLAIWNQSCVGRYAVESPGLSYFVKGP